jgi:hypothetical protein
MLKFYKYLFLVWGQNQIFFENKLNKNREKSIEKLKQIKKQFSTKKEKKMVIKKSLVRTKIIEYCSD